MKVLFDNFSFSLSTGVLYVFPPCDFSTELLKRTCIGLTEEGLKEDHLVIVVVRGAAA
jgi:RNA-binding protein 15